MPVYNFLPLCVYTCKYKHTSFLRQRKPGIIFRKRIELKEFPSPKGDSCPHQGSISVTAPSVHWDVQSDEAEIVYLESCRNWHVNVYNICTLHI